MCCTLLPVEMPTGLKPHGVRCKAVCSKGCKVYVHRPDPCRYWSCRWLFDDKTSQLRRPDRSGYAIDPTLDVILVNGVEHHAVQIWVDPARPNAHRDPALRFYLTELDLPAIARLGETNGILVVPPGLTAEGDWMEIAVNFDHDLRAKILAGRQQLERKTLRAAAVGGTALSAPRPTPKRMKEAG